MGTGFWLLGIPSLDTGVRVGYFFNRSAYTPSYQSGLEDWLRIFDVCVVQGVGQHLDWTGEVEDISAGVEEHRNIVHLLVRGSHCGRFKGVSR